MISLLKNTQGDLLTLHSYDEGKGYIPCGIPTVDGYNEKMCDMIAKISESNKFADGHIWPPIEISHGDIHGIFIGMMKWRRCNGYIVIQKSDRGKRVMVYFHDYMNHSAQSFGTSSVSAATQHDTIEKHINESLAYYTKKIESIKQIIAMVEPYELDKKIEQFGI